ncbi:response regulator [Brevibacillus massiliensis]|uniref:response regulator n=1 Tax=Brevibacillus massiliensis TaxID=1118054 RepID=UPI0002F2211C|nr:response regulator [Brevibacillus massiliensis]
MASQNIFDVIILDIMLPHMNGYEVLEELRCRQIATPVIMLTAKDGIDDKIRSFKKGADDYLVKPFHRGGTAAASGSSRSAYTRGL